MDIFFVSEHAFPDEEQAEASYDHDPVCWNNVFLAFYCCEIPDGQASKLRVGSSVVVYMHELRMKICNSNGCVITLLSMPCSSGYENFVT